jgi:preprotein translocase subunit SecB
MSKPKKSIISISSLLLTDLSFHKNSSKLKRTVIPANAINIEATIQELEQLTYLTECTIHINENKDPKLYFSSMLKYQIVSQAIDQDHLKELETFARFGAIFNAFVHARELIANLTSRSFGKAALFPLLDIRQLGTEIKIITQVIQQEPIKNETNTPELPVTQ